MASMQGDGHRGERIQILEDSTLYKLIDDECWEEAWDLVESDPTAPYNALVFDDVRLYPLHALCQEVKFIDHQEDPEFSEDEDMEHMEYSQKDRERNEEIYRLARFMIQQSHTIQTPIVHSVSYLGQENDTVESHQSILTLKDTFGRTPLYCLLSYSCDPSMIQIILDGALSNPGLLEQVQQVSTMRVVSEYSFDGATPLHLASLRHCPFSSLRLMTQFFHGDRMIPDEDGSLPLHWAMSRFLSSRRLHLLLDGCFESLLVRNNRGMLPLQIMEEEQFFEWDRLDETEQRALWDRLEEVLMVVTRSAPVYKYRWSMIHAIASGLSFIPTRFLQIALEYNGAAATVYDRDGLIPLHVAVSKRLEEESIDMFTNSVQLLITETTVGMRTHSGRLPLHLAAEFNQPEVIVSELARVAPRSLSVIDPLTQLIPFQLAAVEDNNSLTAVYRLLRMDPSLLKSH